LAGVTSHGVVTALNAGLAELKCDIVAITDDDAAPRPEWLARIETHFMQNADVGGVGGRDWVVGEQQAPERTLVGRVQWFGRVVGNHHLGVGGVRDVDILKGVNMSFRTEALAGILFDVNLRGQGAQVWNEMALSFEVKRKGYRLIYDPAIAVDHFPSRRHDYDQRTRFDRLASIDRAFNKFWVFLRCMPRGPRRISALSWELIVGTRDEPGLVHLVTGILRREHTTVERWKCAQLGRKAALEEMRRARQQRR
jgi:cellulose synthase/poly-beta-1,6-N-acetylglucosamine synthase-like glycosyltransferase